MRVPGTPEMCGGPHCHAIVGQELLLVDRIRTFGLQISCPTCDVGVLENDRTNFSKNKLPFPMEKIGRSNKVVHDQSVLVARRG